MNYFLAIVSFLVPICIIFAFFPDGFFAYLVCVPLIAAILLSLNRDKLHGPFLVKVFTVAFLSRTLATALIAFFDLQSFFAEDAIVHEVHGFQVFEGWSGGEELDEFLRSWERPWGLQNLVAVTYLFVGRNPMAVGFVSGIAGALTAVLVFFIAQKVYKNSFAAKSAALLVALFPAMVIWSSQILKDGFVVFFVVLAIFATIRLQEQFNWLDMVVLMFALIGVLSIRYYVFYFAAAACIGSFFFGSQRVLANQFKWLFAMSVVMLVLAYTGLLTVGREQVERLSDLEGLQHSRSILATEAASGYSEETDITTTSGALAAFPIGLTNLLLAPFPWQFTSVRSMLPLPEMIIWWAMFPLMLIGFKYTLFNRFREAIPMLLFTITLTAVYALFQTNVGTAYRQRTQIQVFMFVFIAVGWTIIKERKEDREAKAKLERQEFVRQMRSPAA